MAGKATYSSPPRSVAVVGAGMAGSALTRALLDEGLEVHLFDKSRGPGGRMATRRATWCDGHGRPRVTAFDHGAPWFGAQGPLFRAAVEQAVRLGVLTTWQPRWHPDGTGGTGATVPVFMPAPTMPSWCRRLVDDACVHWEWPVDAVLRTGSGWQLEGHDAVHPRVFDAVVLALPPAQAAVLLARHRRDWAQRASLWPMRPCWTLMGVSDAPSGACQWDAARPATGALGLVLRNDSRPGREARRAETHWVVHATAAWSRTHIEDDAPDVCEALQDELAQWLGTPLRWRYAAAHRWRYAQAPASRHLLLPNAWWDARLRLGVCGEFLGGASEGVEAAWRSAQVMAQRLMQHLAPGAAHSPAHRADAPATTESDTVSVPTKEFSV